MTPLVWLDIGALLVSALISTVLVMLVVGGGPAGPRNVSFALFAASYSLWAIFRILLVLSLQLGAASSGLFAELTAIFLVALAPLLLLFATRYLSKRSRAADAAALAGLIGVALLSVAALRGLIVDNVRLSPQGMPLVDLQPLAILAASLGAFLVLWSLLLLARRPDVRREPFLALGVLVLLAGALDEILRPEFPLLSACNAVAIALIGLGVLRRQVFNPLRETASALEAQIAERTRALELVQLGLENRVRERTRELESEVAERERAEDALRERARRLELVAGVGKQTTAILDLEETLVRAVELVRNEFDYYNVSILLVEHGMLWLRAATREELRSHVGALSLKVGEEGITGWVAGAGAPLLVPDVSKDSRYLKGDDRVATRSELAVPLRLKGEVIGVLDVQSGETDAFSAIDVFTLQTVADQLAVAIENSRLYAETRRRAERLAVVNRVSAAVGSSLELDFLLERVHAEVAPIFSADAFFVAIYHEESAEMEYRYQVDEGVREPPARRPLGTGLSSRVVREGKPLLIGDLEEGSRGTQERWGSMKLPASWLGVPMRLGDRVTGVISVQAYRPDAYGDEELQLLLTISDQVAVAVQRATLYDTIRTELEERTAAEEKFRTLAERSPNMIFINVGGRVVYANRLCEEIMGYSREEFYAPDFDFMTLIAPQSLDLIRSMFRNHMSGTDVPPYEYVLKSKQGKSLEVIISSRLISFGGERGILGIITDITRQKKTELLLQGLNSASLAMERVMAPRGIFPAVGAELHKLGMETLVFLVEDASEQLRLEYVSREPQGPAGAPRSWVLPIDGIELTRRVVRARETLFAERDSPLYLAASEDATEAERRLLDLLGSAPAIAAPLAAEDTVAGMLVVQSDSLTPEDAPAVTAFANQIAAARHKTRLVQELERSLQELKRTQEQLLQSQKMEAVGRLAGGVAHDFNNLLTAIGGYAELLQEGFSPEEQRRGYAEEIIKASRRAAELTRQLLTFSRKSMLQPRVVDLNEVVRNMDGILRRVIGEHIELRTVLDPDLLRVKADSSQIEQAIMNLAVNAGDAMPKGGRLRLETGNVTLTGDAAIAGGLPPGRYVMLLVSDTGVGMTPEVLSHLYEPFFTTKERGKGTGLGLSTVYGIVKQSSGAIDVVSSPGRGSTFRILLPPVDEAPAGGQLEPRSARADRGSETVLVVEDEPAVLELASQALTEQGYTVLRADRAARALQICRDTAAEIHLVVTDVVMPGGIGGQELADEIRRIRPKARVLFISGYAADSLRERLASDPDVHLLEKPFTPTTFALKVREVLDGR